MKYDKVLIGTSGQDEINARAHFPYTSIKIFGLGGNDTLFAGSYMDGGAGDDTLYDGAVDAVIFGGEGNDIIFDSYGNDQFFAGNGDDYFSFDALHTFEGDKNDAFLGNGNDTGVIYLAEGDFQQNIDGGNGFDTLIFTPEYADLDSLNKVMDFRLLDKGAMFFDNSTVKDFERVIFTDSLVTEIVYFGEYNDVFTGWGSNNRVYGFGGNDILHAGASGGNRLYGGEGNDRILADGGASGGFNYAYGEAGNDLIFSRFDHSDGTQSRLSGGAGSDGFLAALWAYKSTSADYVMDFNVKDDWIGFMSDTYHSYDVSVTNRTQQGKVNIVNTKHELSFDIAGLFNIDGPVRLIYNRDNGNLYVQSDTTFAPTLLLKIKGAPNLTLDHFYTMTKQNGGSYEDLLHGDGQSNELFGRGGDDTISGGGGSDTLVGDGVDPEGLPSGNDRLLGGTGNDRLYGGAGKDKLVGGAGQDHLYGESGADAFIYSQITDSTLASAGRDTIYDLTSLDKIDLSAIDAYSKAAGNQAFKFLGSSKFTGKQGEVRYEKFLSDTYIYADVNGDKKADFSIHLDDSMSLTKGFFIL